MSGHRWWPTISPCSPRSFSPEATKIVERPARRTGECLLMSTLAEATRPASARLKKSAHPIVAADKPRRTNPCKHSIRYRARQKISVYGQTLASRLDPPLADDVDLPHAGAIRRSILVTSIQLADIVGDAMGIPRESAQLHLKTIRAAGQISFKGYGRAAADMTALDASRI